VSAVGCMVIADQLTPISYPRVVRGYSRGVSGERSDPLTPLLDTSIRSLLLISANRPLQAPSGTRQAAAGGRLRRDKHRVPEGVDRCVPDRIMAVVVDDDEDDDDGQVTPTTDRIVSLGK